MLNRQSREQAARDANARIQPPGRQSQTALAWAWFKGRSQKTKAIVTTVVMFAAYGAGNTGLEATGLRMSREAAQEEARKSLAHEKERRREAQKEAERERLRRAEQALRDQLREALASVPTAKRRYDDTQSALGVVARYYKEHKPAGFAPDEAWALDRQLDSIEVMPFETAVALIVRSLGRVPHDRVKRAIHNLPTAQVLSEAAYFRAYEHRPQRLPLFPRLPAPAQPVKYTAIDNRPITPAELDALQRRDAKGAIHFAILGIYMDCEEHFRDVYLQHLTALFARYLEFTTPAAVKPQDKVYPLFLLTPEATPNERLNGALLLLAEGALTPEARRGIVETPAMLLGAGCPADRQRYHGRTSSLLSDIYVTKEAPALLKKEPTPADFVQSLKIAYERCRPWTRPFHVHHARELARRAAANKPVWQPGPGEAALLQRLRSSDRAQRLKAVIQVFEERALTPDIARELPRAAETLFHDFCPLTPKASELEDYRESIARMQTRTAEYYQRQTP
jgi:hypothetical protein